MLALLLNLREDSEHIRFIEQRHPKGSITSLDFSDQDNGNTQIQGSYFLKSEKVYAYFVKGMGFEDFIHIYLEIRDDHISYIELLAHSESKGYGDYIEGGWYLDRFLGKSPDRYIEVVPIFPNNDHEVAAITGATITSRAVANAVNHIFSHYKSNGGNHE